MNKRVVPIYLAFLAMGIADAMGPMSDAVKNQFQISNVMATLMSFFVFIAFAVFSVPSGLLQARIGKKKTLLMGLGINAFACFVPMVMEPSYAVLLFCIFLLGVGTTLLQVSGNPIMRDVSSEGEYSKNLSLAQGIKGIGSTVSTYLVTAVAAIAIFSQMGWRASFPLFFIVMATAFVLVLLLKIDEAKADVPPSLGSSLALLSNPTFLMAVIGIFLYVGAEVCMARFLVPLEKAMGMSATTASIAGATLFFGLITVGRIFGGIVKIDPHTFFRASAALGLIGGVLLMLGSPALAVVGVICAGLGFANIWPMLFSITVEEKPEASDELSGLMCMAISGGAIVPLIMSKMVDMNMKSFSFIIPVICFAYLLLLSFKSGKKQAA